MSNLLRSFIILCVILIPQGLLAQATNPDPFNTNRTPAAGQVVTAPPVVVQPEPGVVGWSQTGLLAVLAGLMGKLAFFNKPATPPSVPTPGEVPTHLDPHVLDSVILQLVQSGAPGEAIKVALSFIPGAGPFVSKLEPAFRAIAIKFLQDRVDKGTPP